MKTCLSLSPEVIIIAPPRGRENKIVATFFQADKRGERKVITFLQPSGSGAKYEIDDRRVGGEVSFWGKENETLVTWNASS